MQMRKEILKKENHKIQPKVSKSKFFLLES